MMYISPARVMSWRSASIIFILSTTLLLYSMLYFHFMKCGTVALHRQELLVVYLTLREAHCMRPLLIEAVIQGLSLYTYSAVGIFYGGSNGHQVALSVGNVRPN